jgi:hypothetical protein
VQNQSPPSAHECLAGLPPAGQEHFNISSTLASTDPAAAGRTIGVKPVSAKALTGALAPLD